MKRLTLHFDGGARPTNPGPAGSGFVIKHGDRVLIEGGKYRDWATNNEMEYDGLIRGLEVALDLDCAQLDVFGDSLLVVNQVKGRWKVRARHLEDPKNRAQALIKRLGKKVTLTHVPRTLNKEADAVATRTILTKTDQWSDADGLLPVGKKLTDESPAKRSRAEHVGDALDDGESSDES